jgi:hypothetical protein
LALEPELLHQQVESYTAERFFVAQLLESVDQTGSRFFLLEPHLESTPAAAKEPQRGRARLLLWLTIPKTTVSVLTPSLKASQQAVAKFLYLRLPPSTSPSDDDGASGNPVLPPQAINAESMELDHEILSEIEGALETSHDAFPGLSSLDGDKEGEDGLGLFKANGWTWKVGLLYRFERPIPHIHS